MRIFNKTKNSSLAEKALLADNFFSRAKGLIGRPGIYSGEALVIARCNSIHTFFMQFAIDVLFVDKNNIVVGALNNVKPWRFSPVYWRSGVVIELPIGVIKESKTCEGDEIAFSD